MTVACARLHPSENAASRHDNGSEAPYARLANIARERPLEKHTRSSSRRRQAYDRGRLRTRN